MADTVLDDAQPLLDDIADRVRSTERTVAVAESLTSGLIATQLGAAQESSTWFAGGVVAYSSEVKYSVLGVDRGPVVARSCAEQMAAGVARLLGADVAVAVTGVGGPGEEECQPAGTVYIGGYADGRTVVEEHHLPGDPPEVLEATALRALRLLATLLPTP